MNTTGQLVGTGRRHRRVHSATFKADAVGACQQSGVSVAAVALARGLNAAMLHRWVKQAERSGRPIAIQPATPSLAIEEQFVPVSLPPDRGENVIRIEVRRNGRSISIEWPASAAHQCALLLRELAK